jgi:hypothetical protein
MTEQLDAPAARNIAVCVRGRPMRAAETAQHCCELASDGVVQVGNQAHLGKNIVPRACPRFNFDAAFGADSSQEQLADWVVSAVDGCFEGYNASILAYGQTGSGKTYTMGTSSTALLLPEQHGIVPRAFARIFDEVATRGGGGEAEFEVRASFVEVHDDAVKDLLGADEGGEVLIRENAKSEVVLVGVTETDAASCADLVELLERGTLARTTASTRMNAASSRSHAVFTVVIEQTLRPAAGEGEGGKVQRMRAKLQLVDLAGSERNKRTQTTGQHFKESVNINQGLLALANVINVLSDEATTAATHVPYRDHKLTRLLRNSLGGNARTYMIACISTHVDDFQETLNTLRYAARARNIRNIATVNVDEGEDAQLATMEREMAALKAALTVARQDPGTIAQEAQAKDERNAELEEQVAQLRLALRSAGDGDAEGAARLAAELAEANEGLRKDEEMFAALSIEIEDLAWANSKQREEIAQLQAAARRAPAPAAEQAEEEEPAPEAADDDGDDDESAAVDPPAAAALRQEKARYQDGQRTLKRVEAEAAKASEQFVIGKQMLERQLREMATTVKEKEALVRDLKQERENQVALQQQYAAELSTMREAVERRERDLERLKKQRGRSEEEKRAHIANIREVTSEVETLREQVREQETAMKRMRTADKKINTLLSEVQRMRAERGMLGQKLKLDEAQEKEQTKRREEEVKRLKQQTDGSHRLLRRLKQQLKEQAATMAAQQAELDSARRGASATPPPVAVGRQSLGGLTLPPRASPTPEPLNHVASKKSVRALQRHILKDVEAGLRRTELEAELARDAGKLTKLQGERKRQISQLKVIELRVHRGGNLSLADQAAFRELRETVEDLDTEIEYTHQVSAALSDYSSNEMQWCYKASTRARGWPRRRSASRRRSGSRSRWSASAPQRPRRCCRSSSRRSRPPRSKAPRRPRRRRRAPRRPRSARRSWRRPATRRRSRRWSSRVGSRSSGVSTSTSCSAHTSRPTRRRCARPAAWRRPRRRQAPGRRRRRRSAERCPSLAAPAPPSGGRRRGSCRAGN